MESSDSRVFIVIGSGPGIGVATAKLFAAQAFDKIVLLSRDAARLENDGSAVKEAAKLAGKEVDVECLVADLEDRNGLNKALDDTQKLGRVSCVLFNAARVGPSELLSFDEDVLLRDFVTTNIALYTCAKWAIPLLLKGNDDHPSFFVTSSLLWQEPLPPLFSLSMVKTSQRSLVQSLQMTYKDIHIALLYVAGPVSTDDKVRSPDLVAKKFLELSSQKKGEWSNEMTI